MTDGASIKAQVTDLNTKLDTLITDVGAMTARLEALIAAGGSVSAADLQEISDGLTAAIGKVTSEDTTVNAERP